MSALALVALIISARQLRGERRVDQIVGFVLVAAGVICLGLASGNVVWNFHTIATYCPTHSAGCA